MTSPARNTLIWASATAAAAGIVALVVVWQVRRRSEEVSTPDHNRDVRDVLTDVQRKLADIERKLPAAD
ncbi:MAG: hypothetical protein KGJ62_05120 [Armatimonadetes bacterium]|nr:hypothetical protein [Armatimonadota bacterium]MDE2205443.1 hypothetical protein [Armatimonadota bacterium]